jgi:hypothetical protein
MKPHIAAPRAALIARGIPIVKMRSRDTVSGAAQDDINYVAESEIASGFWRLT